MEAIAARAEKEEKPPEWWDPTTIEKPSSQDLKWMRWRLALLADPASKKPESQMDIAVRLKRHLTTVARWEQGYEIPVDAWHALLWQHHQELQRRQDG